MADLKPCPFCGGQATYAYSALRNAYGKISTVFETSNNIRYARRRGRIMCSRCKLIQPQTYCTISYAENVWNRRPAEDGIREGYNATILRILRTIADTQLAESPSDSDHEDPIIPYIKEGIHDGLQHAYDIIIEMTGIFPEEKR